MTENPRTWQGRTIKNDMPVGGVVSPYGSPENEDNYDSGLEESVRFDQPSSKTLIDNKASEDAQNVIPEPENYGSYYEGPREKSFVEKQTDLIMARVTKPVVPLPSAARFKKATKAVEDFTSAVEKVKDATDETVKVLKEFSEKTDKKPFVPQPHLTQKPFKDKRLYTLRDELKRNNFRIKTR